VGRLGYYFDADLAEYYVRARHYDPRLARWLAVDPIGYEGNNTNLYRYAKNQPTLKVDPDGKIVPAVILGVELGCCGGCALWIGSTLEANWPNCRNQPDPIQCEIDALVAARAGLGWWNRAVLDGECGVCAILLLRRAIMAVSAFCAENPKVCQDIIDAWKRIPW
jgi:RHS repeat-associated protein